MPYFESWQDFEKRKLQGFVSEAIRRSTFTIRPKRKENALAVLLEPEKKPYYKPDGYKRRMVTCPDCKREVREIDGRIISHPKVKGDLENWCKLT